jgi:general secretion pathway protein M
VTNLPHGMRGKILALGLLLVLGLGLHVALAGPLLALFDAREAQLEEMRSLIRRVERGAAEAPALERELATLRASGDIASLTFVASSDAVAAANLQSTLSALAETKGGRLASTEYLAAQTAGQFRRIGVRVALAGDLAMLTAMLAGIEAARPPLFVDNLEIHSNLSGVTEARGPTNLAIAMDVYGFRAN